MKIAFVHYSAPPVVGGVEAVILAHTELLVNSGFNVRLVAGVGELAVLPSGVEFIRMPEMHSLHPDVVTMSQALEKGQVPDDFERFSDFIEIALEKALEAMDIVIVHNIFTKHFNLPLTAALVRLLDRGYLKRCIAWCHDFSWTSPHSQASLHPGYPWDLLRTYRQDVTYVTISRSRQEQLAELYHCPMESIHVIYDGVDPVDIYSMSE
jgi:glycosyltransferase involved in cell wall biosynthesis